MIRTVDFTPTKRRATLFGALSVGELFVFRGSTDVHQKTSARRYYSGRQGRVAASRDAVLPVKSLYASPQAYRASVEAWVLS